MNNIKHIEYSIIKESDDYYPLAIEMLLKLSIKLAGGYYEPKSDRDAGLSKDIIDLLNKHLEGAL